MNKDVYNKSRVFEHGELEETAPRQFLIPIIPQLIIPEMVMWTPKPEIFLSVEIRQSESKFQWQIWGFNNGELYESMSRRLR